MKFYFLIIALVLMAGCAAPQATVTAPEKTGGVSKEIETVVRAYYSKPRASDQTNSESLPPYKVFGVTLQKKNESFYVVGADIETPEGKRFVQQVICRKFSGDGKEYWQAESFSVFKVKQFGE